MQILPKWLAHKDRSLPVTLIVMHATAGGSLSGALQALKERDLSYHFIIEKSGAVTKCVPYQKVAYHAGSSYGPREEAMKVSRAQNSRTWNFIEKTCVNGYSVGISFVNLNDGKDPLTKAQLESAEQLVLELKAALPIRWITTHAAVSPHRKTDPRLFPLVTFAKAVGLEPWQ